MPMLTASVRGLVLATLALTAAGCGGTSLTRPSDLPITEYPAGVEFTMTLVMQPCRRTCETYAASTCDVSVDEDDRIIRVSPQVEVERIDGASCNPSCGGAAVLAHCRVESLEAGAWTVQATDGLFQRTITVR